MQLMENWTAAKEALLEGLPTAKRAIANQLMENQRQHLQETANTVSGVNSVVAQDISNFQKIVIPMIRRIVPGTIATDLVGVQPMSGPVGLVYSLRFAFAEAADGNGNALNDIAAGDEIYGNNSKMKRFYSTANVGTTGYPPALTAATTTGVAAGAGAFLGDGLGHLANATGPGYGGAKDFEGFGGRSIRLQVLKQTITAGSRKLQARWTMEAGQDMTSQHGMNLESELTAALSTQIAHEIDNEILFDLTQLASTVATFDFTAAPTVGGGALKYNFIGDKYAEIGVLVNKLANEIGAKTRRAPANWAVGSHLIVSMLQSGTKSVFAPAVAGSFGDPIGNRMVGTLNGAIKIYSYNWGLGDAWTIGGGADTAMGANGEDILLGYKGGSSELDTGYFYCPYVPLMSTGVVMDANTFMPAVSLMTRYGKATFTNANSSLGNSADYYARINVKNVAFS